MALSGMQIYKLLPRTNCKECGFPTCLAFAMKLAAKQAELSACPYVSDESRAQLEEASQPPIRLVEIKADGHETKAGNETVMFRHEKRFFNKPGLFVRLRDDLSVGELKGRALEIADYTVEYVGMELAVDGIAVEATGDAAARSAGSCRWLVDPCVFRIALQHRGSAYVFPAHVRVSFDFRWDRLRADAALAGEVAAAHRFESGDGDAGLDAGSLRSRTSNRPPVRCPARRGPPQTLS